MPKNKLEEFVFTLITSGFMIFIMGVYNVAINTRELKYSTFSQSFHSFPLEWLLGFIFAFSIASKTSKYFAFKVAMPTDRPILKILCIQTFTVCTMVPLMSLVGTIGAMGITADLPLIWLKTVIANFAMAFPLQIFVVGPLCRWIFRCIFVKKSKMDSNKTVLFKD